MGIQNNVYTVYADDNVYNIYIICNYMCVLESFFINVAQKWVFQVFRYTHFCMVLQFHDTNIQL